MALVWRQAPIQQRHALIERLRELMPNVSVRKLCYLLNINRQWYYQHRHSCVKDDRDRFEEAIAISTKNRIDLLRQEPTGEPAARPLGVAFAHRDELSEETGRAAPTHEPVRDILGKHRRSMAVHPGHNP